MAGYAVTPLLLGVLQALVAVLQQVFQYRMAGGIVAAGADADGDAGGNR